MDVLGLAAALLAAVAAVLGALVLVRVSRLGAGGKGPGNDEVIASLSQVKSDMADAERRRIEAAAQSSAALSGVRESVVHLTDRMGELQPALAKQILEGQDKLSGLVLALSKDTKEQVDAMRTTNEAQLKQVRESNEQQLEKIRSSVEEKLTKAINDRLTASFSQINENLDAVNKGLGEMRTLASSVGDLKKVFSNVKTRGILGEIQLGTILTEILSPEQYETNVATKPGSAERVEYAIRIPVEDAEDDILLPIDAKFPGDTFLALREALDLGDEAAVDAARKALITRIRQEAKDISTKYLSVPETTNFAIMFLPFEGLYAEVVNTPGLVLELQSRYNVNVCGPSTMAALLNSLQMSYQTVKLQKQTDEVLKVLQAVKAELPKYQQQLQKAKDQIDRAGRTVDGILTTRTNAMERKLKTIGMEGFSAADASLILGTSDFEVADEEEGA